MIDHLDSQLMSQDRRKRDTLDELIRQTLADSVMDEEPPAHVWERIRAQLNQPDRGRSSVRWSTPMLQAALLTLLLMLGSLSIRQRQSIEQVTVQQSKASSTTPQVPRISRSPKVYDEGAGAVSDTTEIVLLREYSASHSRAVIIGTLRRRAPGVAVPAYDIPPHPYSPEAKALLANSSPETGLTGF